MSETVFCLGWSCGDTRSQVGEENFHALMNCFDHVIARMLSQSLAVAACMLEIFFVQLHSS